MTERHIPLRARDRLYAAVTMTLAVLLLPAAFVRSPRRTRDVACQWALRLRFPAEDLTGLTEHTKDGLRGPPDLALCGGRRPPVILPCADSIRGASGALRATATM